MCSVYTVQLGVRQPHGNHLAGYVRGYMYLMSTDDFCEPTCRHYSKTLPLCVQVRRDNCPLVANLINTCLHKLLIDRWGAL